VAETRLRAVSLLSQLGDEAKRFLPELQNSFVTADDVYFKASIVQAIGNIAGRESFAFLIRCLEDRSFLVRLAALRALAGILRELSLKQRFELKKKLEQVMLEEESARVREEVLLLMPSLARVKP
jgi:HEAT repeat protein